EGCGGGGARGGRGVGLGGRAGPPPPPQFPLLGDQPRRSTRSNSRFAWPRRFRHFTTRAPTTADLAPIGFWCAENSSRSCVLAACPACCPTNRPATCRRWDACSRNGFLRDRAYGRCGPRRRFIGLAAPQQPGLTQTLPTSPPTP